MDFLLSYPAQEDVVTHEDPFKHEITTVKRTPFMKFVMLSVDNDAWKFLQILGVCLRYFATMYMIGFSPQIDGIKLESYITIFCDILYIVDFISALTYRWVWPKSNVNLQRTSSDLSRLVWKNRLFQPRKVWMLFLDIISVLPFELIRIWVPFDWVSNSLIHLPSLLRIYRLPVHYIIESTKISLRVHVIFALFARIGLFWAVLSHSFICIWGLLSEIDNDFKTHDNVGDIKFNSDDDFNWYLIYAYFIQIAFTNTGFGDIVPCRNTERIFAIVILLMGFSLLSGYFIAALSSVVMEKVKRLTHLQYRLSLMTFELNSKTVPETVRKKIIKFYYSLWASRLGIGPYDDLLNSLPPSLSSQVYHDIFTPALNASLVFRSCDEYSKRAIARVMKINLYLAGDAILKRREYNSQMFYIRKGTIQIMSYQDDETEVMTFGAGTVFGQIALVLCLPTKSEVHAATFCEIHSISKKDLFTVLKDYPSAKEVIFNVHKNLLLNVMADKFETEKKLKPGNVLTVSNFYKKPIKTSKLARDDICIVTTCPYVYMPDTIFLKSWNAFVAIIIVLISFYYPYVAAFKREYPTLMEPYIILVDIIFLFNLYLTFSTAFVKENIIFSSLRDIIAFRLTTIHAAVDIAAIMPIHYFMHNENRLKPVLLCFRCLLFYKIHIMFKYAESTTGMTTIFCLRLIKYILYFLFGAYVMGLSYYIQACYNDPCLETSWFIKFNITRVTEPIWVSVYFATLVMTGTGFGDITVGNINDLVFVILFTGAGAVLFIYLIADYSANISLGREPRQQFVELADQVNSFLRGQKMLRSERTRVRQFLNLQWERSKGYEFTSSQTLFYDTPSHLLYEANLYTKSQGLQRMKLFQGIDSTVLGAILNSAIRIVFPPHEVVIYAGELCNYLMIIEEGYCEVTYGKDVSITKILEAGQDICTVELMLGLTALCHVRTLTHCVIIKVSKANLNRALSLQPIGLKEIEEAIEEFKSSAMLRKVQESRPIPLHLTVRNTVEKSLYKFRYYRKQSGNKDYQEPYLRLGLCQWIKYILRNTTVLPYGKFLKRWEFSRCIFGFFSAMIFPCIPYFQLQFRFLYNLGVFLDVAALIDLYFRVHVCYYNKKNILVSHPLWTCSHYLKGSFVWDFIFCFPFDRIMYRRVYDSKGEAFVTGHSVDFLRILRVGQVYRIPAILNFYGKDFLSTPPLFWVILSASSLTFTFINLLTSILVLMCVNYKVKRDGSFRIVYQSLTKDHMESLLNSFNFTTNPIDIFILNFYWTATTAFGVGFGDITASTTQLMIYVIAVIALSYLYFNYVTVITASYLTSVNMNLTMYQKRMGHLVRYLHAENVEPLLRAHIVNHFEYIWKKNRGMKAQYVFFNFNSALRDDVMFHLYEETVKGVPAFSHFDPSFHRLLSSRLDEIYFQSGAAIYKPGDIISQFFIVHQGEVTIVGKNENETIELGRSKVFGLFENVMQGTMTLSAVATKNVTVLAIEAVDLYQILENTQRGIVEKVQDEKQKLSEALETSNKTKTEMDDEPNYSSKTKNSFVHIVSRFSKMILMFYVILSLYSANITTYNLAFQYITPVLIYSFFVVEFLFVIKIFLGFHTGYVDEFGEFVSDLRLIKTKYITTTSFYVDVITTIPIDLLAFIADKKEAHYVSTWLRLPKLLRLYNVWSFFNTRFDTLSVNMVLLKVAAVGIWTGTFLHQFSCIWFIISCPKSYCPDSVIWQRENLKDRNYQYSNCLYFIVSVLTTTGFGDITPHTMPEILYVTTMCFVSFFYTALFIGETVSTTQKYLFAKRKYEFEIEGLKNYLYVNDVPQETQKVIFTYVKNLWNNERGLQVPDLLRHAPRYLTYEIKQSTYGHHITEHPVFKACSPNFRKQLITNLIRTVYYPTDIIVFKGEVNGNLYFVNSGQVECHDYKNDPSKIYVENTSFGLAQCVKPKLPHKSTFYALTSCVILTLNLSKHEYLHSFFPNDLKYLNTEAEKIFTIENEGNE